MAPTPPSLTLRARISSPLEAGPSILDCHQLPAHVNGALEYASKRLARKSTNITLVAVSRDYQLPTSPITSPTPGCFTPGSFPVSAVTTPSRAVFPPPPVSKLDAIKQLWSHNNPTESPIRERILHVHLDRFRDGTASPAFSEASTTSSSTTSSVSTADSTFSNRFRWPGSPMSASVPLTPATPFTVMSSSTEASSILYGIGMGMPQLSRFGMKLIYAQPLEPRDEKILSQTLEKAAKKFRLSSDWMPKAVLPSSLGLPADLIRKSLVRNETLFSSSNLTLVSLDQLYNFRTALQAYARTKATCRLEDAVDELRRLFLSNGRRPLLKSILLSSYRWLDPVNENALADVCHMYERAYGGIEKESGIEDDIDSSPSWPFCLPTHSDESDSDSEEADSPVLSDPEKLSVTYISASSLHKELLLDGEEDDQEDIEAWYRQVSTTTTTTTMTMTPTPPAPAAPKAPKVPKAVVIHIDPLRSHPPTIEIPPPSPPPPPPPPKTTIITQEESSPPEHPALQRRQSTPKLRPAPPSRPLALKLQTSFPSYKQTTSSSKTTQQLKRPVATRPAVNTSYLPPPPCQSKFSPDSDHGEEDDDDDNDDDEDEDPETARPLSAVRTVNPIPATVTTTTTTVTPSNHNNMSKQNNNNNNHHLMLPMTNHAANNVRHKNTGSILTINEMLHSSSAGLYTTNNNNNSNSSSRINSTLSIEHGEQQHQQGEQEEEQQPQQWVAPMTPNGYDDISPITRGEWGFLMFGHGKKGGVETVVC